MANLKRGLHCIVCESTNDFGSVSPDLALTTGIAIAMAFHEKSLLTRDIIQGSLCKRHVVWFEQEFTTMMENAPKDD